MSGRETHTRKTDAVLDEEAARWSERLRETPDDAELHAAFETWVCVSPARRAAFDRAERAWSVARAFADAPELASLRSETLSRTVIQREARRFSARAFAMLAASLLFVVMGASVWFSALNVAPQDAARVATASDGGKLYETAVGQRLVVTLGDGSVITLDTASRVSVSYSALERRVSLSSGQAFFKVAHDGSRPFVVIAGGKRVVALGTQFDVRLSQDGVAVTLVEGRVRVEATSESPDAAPLAELTPGQQLVARSGSDALVRETDVTRATSWRHGQAIFENDALADAVAEMNRYSHRPIVLADARLRELRISGAFETGQSDAFVEALTTYFPTIVVKTSAKDRIELAWRN